MNPFYIKRAFALVVCIFLFLEAKAQTDFRPGYLITTKGDTVNGLVNFRSDIANAKNCVFKKDHDQEKEVYTPDQIKGYRFLDGKYYLSSNTFEYPFENKTFIEAASQGLISVYYYKEENREHYFVKKDTLLVELDHYKKYAGTLSTNNIEQEKAGPEKFRGQLKYLMWDQPSLHPKIERASCDLKELVALAKAYQKLSAPAQEYVQFEQEPSKKLKTKVGVFASGGLSHLKTPPYNMYINDYDFTKYLEFEASFAYEVGAQIDLSMNFLGENKYFLQFAPALNVTKFTSFKELNIYPLLYSYKTDIQFTTLKVPMMLKYSFYRSNASIIPYFKAGPGCAIYWSQNGNFDYRTVPVNGPASQETVYSESLATNYEQKPIRFYFISGAGVDINKGKHPVSLGVVYETGEGPLDTYRNEVQFQVGLQF